MYKPLLSVYLYFAYTEKRVLVVPFLKYYHILYCTPESQIEYMYTVLHIQSNELLLISKIGAITYVLCHVA